jgi:AcrR family transcriptional regulator
MASDTRDRILSVAARLFEASGFEGTSVAAILRAADVNSGSLYHFFASKEVLLVAVLEHHLACLEPTLLDPATRATDEPVERVFALLELYRGRLVVSGFTRGCAVADLLAEVGTRHGEARAVGAAYFARWTERVRTWIAADAGSWSGGVDAEALSRLTLSVAQGAIVQARAAGSIEGFDAAVAQLRLLFGLLRQGTEPAGRTRPTRRPTRPRASEVRAVAEAPAERPAEGVGAEDPAWWKAW